MEYAKALGASTEVLQWCATVLAARQRKQPLATQVEVEHIIDFLVSPAAPSRLRRMSYQQALAGAEKWSAAQQKKGMHIQETAQDVEVLHEFADGARIVKLLTKTAYQREGFLMRHCLGGYNVDNTTIYSYRDAGNQPHATFEVSRCDDEIQQIKGKGNGPIHPRYIEPILVFLKTIGKSPRPAEMKHLGYYHIPADMLPLLNKFDYNKADICTLYGEQYAIDNPSR